MVDLWIQNNGCLLMDITTANTVIDAIIAVETTVNNTIFDMIISGIHTGDRTTAVSGDIYH